MLRRPVIITDVPLGLKVPQSWKLKNEVFQLESSEELFTNHFTGIHYHHPQCQTDEKWKREPFSALGAQTDKQSYKAKMISIFCSFRWQKRNLRSIILETNLIVLRKKTSILPGLINDATQADKISLYRSTSLANSIDFWGYAWNNQTRCSRWSLNLSRVSKAPSDQTRTARPVEPVREKQRPQDASRCTWNICVWLRCSSAVWIIPTVHLVHPWK